MLALAAIAALELTCWLSPGLSNRERTVTAIAAVLYAAPIAVRRVWPAAALVFSMAVVTVSMPFGGQLLSNDNAYVIPPLLLAYSAGAGLDVRRSAVALIRGLGVGLGMGAAPRPRRIHDRGGAERLGSVLRDDAARADLADRPLCPPARPSDQRLSMRLRRGPPLRRIRTTRRRSRPSGLASARNFRTSSPTASARWSSKPEARGCSCAPIPIGPGTRFSPSRRPAARRSATCAACSACCARTDDPRALSPQPGLGQVAALIESLRGTGLDCERQTVGEPVDLTPGVDLVAYRVIETALKAAAERHVRHSSVTVNYGSRDLELEVRGDGTIPDLDGTFAPLVDRVGLYRGELRTEPQPAGFALRARLPLDPVGLA